MSNHHKIIISLHGVPPKVQGKFSKKRFSWGTNVLEEKLIGRLF